MTGSEFGQYRLLDLLGRGGMGQVYRAYDTATERIVALKVLAPNLAEDERFKERFRREAHAAARLTEPHVIPIHAFGEIDRRLYVDMRLIEGKDLEEVLKAGALEPHRCAAIVEQIAAALSAAHRVGLIHRDIKPSNIIVAENDFAYLIDFGIARAVDDTRLTATGSAVGTFAYMAPERFQVGQVDARSDIYALACVLHQSLTGQQPFAGTSAEQQIAAHLMTPPPRPSQLGAGLAPEFDAVVAKGMAKNPDDRYQTAMDLGRAARGAAYGAGSTKTPPQGLPLLTRFAPSDTPPTAPTEPRVVDPAFAEMQMRSPSQQPTDAPQPVPGRRWPTPAIVLAVVLAVVATVAVVAAFVGSSGDDEAKPTPTTASAAPPPGPATSAAAPAPPGPNIDTLLLDANEISSAMGVPGMAIDGERYTRPYRPADMTTQPPECNDVSHSGVFSRADLDGSGWTAVRGETYKGPRDSGSPMARQSVVEMPNAELAKKLVDRFTGTWQPCNGKIYTQESGSRWQSTVTPGNDRTTAMALEQSGRDWSCESVIAAMQNFATLTRTCKYGAPQAHTIADRIAARINPQ